LMQPVLRVRQQLRGFLQAGSQRHRTGYRR
jgi:hypothetical protein